MSHTWSANNTNKIKLRCQHYSWPGFLVSLEIINPVACFSALPVKGKNITPVYKHIGGLFRNLGCFLCWFQGATAAIQLKRSYGPMSVQIPLLSLNIFHSCLSSTLCDKLPLHSSGRKSGCMYPIRMQTWETLILSMRSDTIWPMIICSSMHMKHFKILYGSGKGST